MAEAKPPLFTIGFTQSSAEHFFARLEKAGVKRVIDVRLHPDTQLSGFAKRRDLPFLLERIGGIAYRHEPLLAPTEELMALGRAKKREPWASGYKALLAERRVESALKEADFHGACLLCAEAKPHDCHRSFAADYLQAKWGVPFAVTHL